MTERWQGSGHCKDCNAVVMNKEDRGGKVYHVCNGDHDPSYRGCGGKHYFGRVNGDKMKMEGKADATEETKPEQSEQPAEPGNKPERKSGSGLFGYSDA